MPLRNPAEDDASVRAITGSIVDAAIGIHRRYGPGLLERPYRLFLAQELRGRGHHVGEEVPVELEHQGVRVAHALRLDLLVDERVIVEVKAQRALEPVHFAQLLTYLRLTKKDVGLLLNFHVPLMRDGIHRLVRRVE